MEGIINLISNRFAVKQKVQEKENLKKAEILSQMKDINIQMTAIQSCFDLETNFDLIDSYIMELESLEKRYNYLFKQAKQENIKAF